MKSAEARSVVRSFVLSVSFLVLLGGLALPLKSQDSTLTFYPVQVLNTYENRVCQHVYDPSTQNYRLAWQSAILENYSSVRKGDIDNDGSEEVIAALSYVHHTEGTRKNQVAYYGYRVHVFKQGAAFDGGPTWSVELPYQLKSNWLRECWIGDVDLSHAGNELVVMHTYRLAVFNIDRDSTGGLILTGGCIGTFANATDSIDVGDADNDGLNEIVVESGQRPWVWKWTGGSPVPWEQDETALVPLEEYGDANPLNLTHVRVRDADNCGQNEIISTGTNERLMVWRWNGTGAYEWITAGPDLIGNMAYGLDCGDVNGDGPDEVVLGVWSIRAGRVRLPSRIVALAYGSGVYTVANTCNVDYYLIHDVRVADLTGDGRAEVIVKDDGDIPVLRILKFVGDDLLTGHFEHVYEAPGNGITRIEIR